MVVGFNHNIRYKNQLFHIQTEDSGVNTPHIITLLYVGGTILASKKTSYADITKVDNLEMVVEELMKEQHKKMLLCLKNGEYDQQILALLKGKAPAAQPSAAKPAPAPSPVPAPEKPAPAKKAPAPSQEAVVETNLDEIILSYLVGDDKK